MDIIPKKEPTLSEHAYHLLKSAVEAGADMLFPEAITDLAMYKQFSDKTGVPILANITEFGSTPLYTTDELASVDVSLVLYPLSAFRAMNKAAENVYNAIRKDGTQKKYHRHNANSCRIIRTNQLSSI